MSLVHQYITFLNLEKLKMTGEHYRFKCPFCSQDRNDTTALILHVNSEFPSFCCHRCHHQCGEHNRFDEFLKELNYYAWTQYINEWKSLNFDKFVKNGTDKKSIKVKEVKRSNIDLKEFYKWMKPLSEFPESNELVQYMMKRNIPKVHYDRLFYFSGNPYRMFKKLFKSDQYGERSDYNLFYKGVLVPFFNENSKSVGFGIRLVNKGDFRFINLILEEEKTFFFGEDKVNWQEEIFIVEGLIDKITLKSPQFISMISANQKVEYLKKKARNKVTYVYDFEYLNKNIVNSINKVIDNGFDVFLAPHNIDGVKDINDLKCKYKWNDKDIIDFIKKNSYNGITAKMILSDKINEAGSRLLYRR